MTSPSGALRSDQGVRRWIPYVAAAVAFLFTLGVAGAAAGDYAAGPSHVLPTGGTARFAAGLSANDFLRGGSVIRLAREDLLRIAADIATLADTEGLTAHRRSVEARLPPG